MLLPSLQGEEDIVECFLRLLTFNLLPFPPAHNSAHRKEVG